MKYIGTYSNDADIATKAKVDAKQDKVLVNGILKGDGQGAISAAETQEVELVTLTKADVGLGNVDNTSDANKPISTATQAALNDKQATITGGASTITSSNLTANRALVSNADGKVAVSAVTATELGYLDGVTSNIQTQLNGKLSTAPVTSVNSKTGAVELSASDVGAQPTITANGFLKGDGSGGITADKPVFVVNLSHSEFTITSDKTAKQIYDAYDSGYNVIGYLDGIFFQLGVCGYIDQAYSIMFSAVNYPKSLRNGALSEWFVMAGGVPKDNTTFQIAAVDTVPPTRTINDQPLSSDITLNASDVGALPNVSVTASDNGKFLRVVNGAWAAATVENANGVSF